MNDEPAAPADLAAIDLSLSFAPAWAKESDPAKQAARLAAKHGGGEDRGDRPGKRWEDRGARPDRRPPRGAGGGGGRPDRPTAGRRDDRRPPQRAEREAPPEPALAGWDVQFLPDRKGVEGLAKQIRASAKAYPLFDLARLVLDKSERYLVQFKRTAESATALFQLKSDGSLWLNENEAVAHALSQQLEKFYRRERVAVEPPKGVYPFVAVCGMSGTLLGPPNYHDYQTKIRQLHAERFASVPFEVFKARIRMERGEEMIARWREEQSAKDVFYPVDLTAPAPTPETPVEVPSEETTSPEPVTVSEESPVEPAPENAGSEPVSDAVAEAPVPPSDPVEATAEPIAGETPAEEVAPAAAAETLGSLAEVERHFREHHVAGLIVKIRDRVVAPGPAALNDSAPAVLLLTRGAWEQLSRFPLPLAHTLGQQLVGRGLQIFKSADNITYVGVARPRYLDRQASPVSEALAGILDYLEGHASTPRAEQWKALLGLRVLPEGAGEGDREAALMKDLSWLLHEGHVIDFAKRGLEAARRPKSRPTAPAPKVSPASPVAEAEVVPDPVAEIAAEPTVEATPQPVTAETEVAPEIPPAPELEATPEVAPVADEPAAK